MLTKQPPLLDNCYINTFPVTDTRHKAINLLWQASNCRNFKNNLEAAEPFVRSLDHWGSHRRLGGFHWSSVVHFGLVTAPLHIHSEVVRGKVVLPIHDKLESWRVLSVNSYL